MIKRGLIDDPIGWVEKGIGSKLRFICLLALHVSIGVWLFIKCPVYSTPVFLLTTAFPIMYLYAMKKLIEELKSNRPREKRVRS